MFAVFKTGGKQYRVAAEDVLKVDKVKGAPGEIVEFGEVLVVGGDSVTLGAPTVAGATVAAEVLDQARGPKIIAFKKRRRKNSRRKRGHRQEFTLVRITEILTDGKKPSKTAPPRPKRAPAPATAAPDDAAATASETASEGATAKTRKAPAKKAAKLKSKPQAKKPAAKAKRPEAKGNKKK
ncbi:MAG: 50S ribosomal protein L21 [Xanthobacteraceae bacterium]|jgi:large subunit ribosomal protein L21